MKSLLISHCLLGENVRYDGGHCFVGENLTERLKKNFNLIAICPEVMAGMGTPRVPIEIVGDRVVSKDGDDVTALFEPVYLKLKEIVTKNQISYALLKEFSPSCGSKMIYSGNFDGKIIEGQGVVCNFLISLGVKVYSEKEISELLEL